MAGGQIDFLLTPYIYNGSPLSGGTVEVFVAGTSTPVTVYADKDLATPLGTSVTLDSSGTALAFADGTQFLKLVVKDSDSNTLQTYDGVNYKENVSGASDFYLRDGTLPLTGNMNVAGYDFSNCGNVTLGNLKYININHGHSYTPTTDDQLIWGDASGYFRQFTSTGKSLTYADTTLIREDTASAINLKVPLDVTGDITVSGTVDGIDVATDVAANTTHRSSAGTDHSDVVLNNTHRSSDGTDHTYIDQDVTSGTSPTFDGTNFTGIPNGALVTNPLARANHTGTQVASTISDFDTEVSNNTDVTANTTHRTSTGTDHTYIDQSVTTLSAPTFFGGTFTNFPITPSAAPTTDYQVANKKYVDDTIGASTFVDVDAAAVGGISTTYTTVVTLALTGAELSGTATTIKGGGNIATITDYFGFGVAIPSGSTTPEVSLLYSSSSGTASNEVTVGTISCKAVVSTNSVAVQFKTSAATVTFNAEANGITVG